MKYVMSGVEKYATIYVNLRCTMNSFRKLFLAYFSAHEMIFEKWKFQNLSDFCL